MTMHKSQTYKSNELVIGAGVIQAFFQVCHKVKMDAHNVKRSIKSHAADKNYYIVMETDQHLHTLSPWSNRTWFHKSHYDTMGKQTALQQFYVQ